MNAEEILAAQQALFDAADAESRPMTEEEATKFEDLEKSLKAVQKTEELRKRQAAYAAPRVNYVTGAVTRQGKESHPMVRKYAKDFENAPDRAEEIDRFLAFDNYLRTGRPNTDLQVETFAQGEGTTAGGYLVPTSTMQRIVEVTKLYGGISPYCTHLSTGNGNPINYPTIDDTANTGAVTAEGSAGGSGGADLVFGQVTLSAYKLAATGTGQNGLIVSNELIADAQFDVVGFVTRFMGIRLARGLANLYINGTGSSQPSGLLNTSGNASKLAITGGQFVSVTEAIKETVALQFALDPSYWPGARWLMGPSTLQQFVGLVDGQNRPLLQALAMSDLSTTNGNDVPAGTVQGYSLLGYPVVVDAGVPAYSATAAANPDPGTNNDIYLAFGNLERAFVVRDVQGVSILTDPFGKMNVNSIQYFGYARTDSKIQDRNAFKTQAGYHT